MKLLIVDDEELTRTGLISAIDWKSLGIDQIIQADDGIHGLEQARLYKPEIILCDVRMPRMNGITMLERLEKLLPDSVPVFLALKEKLPSSFLVTVFSPFVFTVTFAVSLYAFLSLIHI